MNSFKEVVVFVTGGLSGIGLAIVKEILKHGAKGVAIVDWADEKANEVLEELAGNFGSNKAIFIKTNVANEDELKNAFEKTIKQFNQLDVVINNAGIVDEFDRKKVLDINLGAVVNGTYLALETYLPKYRSQSEGVIINISSICGLRVLDFIPMYSATKHALVGLGRCLGQKTTYQKFGVRILTLCPGFTTTNLMNDNIIAEKTLYPEKVELYIQENKCQLQGAEFVADAVIRIVKEAENGSVWVAENKLPPYEVQFEK